VCKRLRLSEDELELQVERGFAEICSEGDRRQSEDGSSNISEIRCIRSSDTLHHAQFLGNWA